MANTNIWDGIEFSDKKIKTAYDYLISQSDNLIKMTQNHLKMEVERVDAMYEIEHATKMKPVVVNTMYIVAPRLAGFRKKILVVIEYKWGNNFPVDIHVPADDSKKENVKEEDFLNEIAAIMKKTEVLDTIHSLYKLSLENERDEKRQSTSDFDKK